MTIEDVDLRIPVLEAPGSLDGLVSLPAPKVLPVRPGIALAPGYEAIGAVSIDCQLGGELLPAGTPCDDGDPCTPDDTCNDAGLCVPGGTTTCGEPTETPTASPTPPIASHTPTATPVPACVGDCDLDGEVTIAELMQMVNIALGRAAVGTCEAGDANDDGAVTIDELLKAVRRALDGCG